MQGRGELSTGRPPGERVRPGKKYNLEARGISQMREWSFSRKRDLLLAVLASALRKDSIKGLPRVDLIFFSADSNKNELTENGRQYDRLLDPLREHLEKDGFSTLGIAKPPARVRCDDAYSNWRFINRAFLYAKTKDALTPKCRKRNAKKILFKKILLEARPSVVIGIGGRDYIWDSARELGIRYVEIVHARGYPELTDLFGQHQTLPSDVVLFDTLTKSLFPENGSSETKTHLVTDYWTAHFKEEPEPRGLNFPAFFKAEKKIESFEFRFTITLPPEIPSGWGELFRKLTDSLGPRAYWMFRTHPTNNKHSKVAPPRRLKVVLENQPLDNVDYFASSREPIPYLFSRSTHHITLSSASAYEAGEFRVPTIAIDRQKKPIDRRQLEPLHRLGLVTFVAENSDAILNAIKTVDSPTLRSWSTAAAEDIQGVLKIIMRN